jgi:hypothetical protein
MSVFSVSDNNRGDGEYRADELYDLHYGDQFAKKSDVYAIGVVMQKLSENLSNLSHEMKEAIKIATDPNIEGRATLKQLKVMLL